VALFLKKHGIGKVFPLAGGMNRWLELGYPTETVDPDV
jgi:rhodanese-related sulfurtransferase